MILTSNSAHSVYAVLDKIVAIESKQESLVKNYLFIPARTVCDDNKIVQFFKKIFNIPLRWRKVSDLVTLYPGYEDGYYTVPQFNLSYYNYICRDQKVYRRAYIEIILIGDAKISIYFDTNAQMERFRSDILDKTKLVHLKVS